MTSNLYLRRFTGAASPLALGVALAMTANPAAAQSTTPPAPSPVVTGDASQATAAAAPVADPATTPAVDPNADSSVVVVRGFRAALQSAVNKKKNSDQVVESVSAEDIGKLPDASIGESIARLPGIASQRTNGRASGIAIRGFGPDFSTTLLNGREQTSTNDSRGVEFDQYPSEIVSRVDVYKTPSAALIGQGLVGTIDVRTARPLDYSKPVVAIGARASYDDIGKRAGFPKYGKRFNGTFIDQFADKRVGISLSASYLDETYPNQQFNAWGYAGSGTASDPYVIGGSKSYVTTTRLKRYGINGTLQFKPTDTVTITADGFYSHFNDDGNLKGIELPLAYGGGFNTTGPVNTTVSNNTIVSGTFPTVYGVVRNDVFQRKAKLYSGGLNLTWNPGNDWSGFFDYGRSRTRRNELSIESYSGTGYGNNASDPSDRIGFTSTDTGTTFTHVLNYSDPNLIKLTDPLGWGGSTLQSGYYNNRIVKDDLAQYRAEVSHQYNSFFNRLRLGFNFTDRKKSLTPDEALITLPNGQTFVSVPSQYVQAPTNLDYLGLGPILSYDPRQLLANGVLVFTPNTSPNVPLKAFTIKERLAIPYVQVDLKGQFGSAEVTGNFGVQAIHTNQSSAGLFFVDGNPTAQRRTLGAKYLDILPSANLSLRYPGGQVIRFGVAREIERPRLDDLREAFTYSVTTNPANCPTGATSCYTGSGGDDGKAGNPYLRPYRANAVDLTFEQYFAGSKGYAALQLFYKDISSYISDGRVVQDFSGLPAPLGVLPGTSTIGYTATRDNTPGGSMYGAELATTLPFNVFTETLDGFGVTGGVGYTKTKVRDLNGNITTIPGYSKWVANGTLFFEKWGFNARGSVRYRSSFLGDFSGFGGNLTRRTALAETIVDGQIGYDFGEGTALHGLSLYLQGQNLTDERFESVATASNPLTVIDHQTYGRRYLAGFTYKF